MRWALLAAILVVLLVTLVPTARSLWRQQADIADLRVKVAEQERTVADLRAEQQRWQDPAYVEQQARERLKFVKVGDRSYSVIEPGDAPRPTVTGASVAAPQVRGDSPWHGQVWQSIVLADRPTPATAPAR